jgi:hypothetical protein
MMLKAACLLLMEAFYHRYNILTSLPTAHLENCFLIVVSGVTPTRKCDFSAYKTVCFETFYYKIRVKQYNTIT